MQMIFREPLALDETTRAALPGEFVALSGGVTHYEAAGPDDGRPAVLIHGFSTPMFLWDDTLPALAGAGCRAVRYDLLGRGFSDRPPGRYDLDRFDRQLLDLADALGLERVSLLGLSMGGLIAVTFADRHPDRVDRLALIGPAGFGARPTLAVLLLWLPVIGEIVMALAGDRVVLDGLAHDFHDASCLPAYQEKYRAQLPYRGFKRALLSTLRSLPVGGADVYRRVGQQGRDILLIWGQEDRTIPLAISEQVRAALPGAVFHAIPGAGHMPHYEQPDVVNPILVEFLCR